MNDTVNGALDQLLGLSPPATGFVALLVLNLILRRIPHVDNRLIPVITVVAGTPLFAWLLTLGAATKANPFGLNCIYGFVISGIVGCFYGAIVIFAESKWPAVARLINAPENSPDKPEDKPPTQPPEP